LTTPAPVAPQPTSAAPAATAPAAVAPAAQPELETALTRLRTRPSGTHELTVQLHPADLGAVRVVARLSGDQLDVTVLCADHAAQQAVAAAVPALQDRLSDLRHLDISASLAGPPNHQPATTGDGSHGRPQGGADREPAPLAAGSTPRPTPTDLPNTPTPRRAPAADARFDRRI
jgi:hypothetical protein